MDQTFTLSQLTSIVSTLETINDPIAQKYKAWRELSETDGNQLVKIGKLIVEIGDSVNLTTTENYWSEKYPISIALYPYEGCDICQYGTAGGYYFVYLELGGHAAEKRCRLIQKELIVLKS